ncbi:hypothetical protein IE81DRAFT_331365 [Ceraceosorus guamensis]|uniref:Mannose-6-phosphate isomerase n=1 Tax=Ceraceosorus guamensis TaxID=1522189 RepID=A0A316VT43_9BASI|nr:hypothetical protein IE81DRAFT_331365 [Ceraceosorus guamensis]PWN40809.1 hypothetical protein IE81DRAFT_331365 [Ceraceosorus guamensis]
MANGRLAALNHQIGASGSTAQHQDSGIGPSIESTHSAPSSTASRTESVGSSRPSSSRSASTSSDMPSVSSEHEDRFGPYGPFGPTFALIPQAQNYEWGVIASDGSLVAKYASATVEADVHIKDSRPYAELWMGTHPSLPSLVIPPKQSGSIPPAGRFISLSSYLSQHTALQGKVVARRFRRPDGELPYLFKILSVAKALSIQAHPDKSLAERLHREKPKSYKDDNHKPEMAIALTSFRGFCGFRPLKEMATYLDAVPEFQRVVNAPSAFAAELAYKASDSAGTSEDEARDWVRGIFSRLMNAQATTYKSAVMDLAARYRAALQDGVELEVDKDLAGLLVTLNEQYPGDVGVLCAFVLNVVDLQPGQALFLGANEPHAYIKGDIVECMASSDNVVRAGLTPKERDTETLVSMLTYNSGSAERQLMSPSPYPPAEGSLSASAYEEVKADSHGLPDVPSLLYDPPIEEFCVIRTTLRSASGPQTWKEETQKPLDGPSVLIVTSGQGSFVSIPQPVSHSNGHASHNERPSDTMQPDSRRQFELERAGQLRPEKAQIPPGHGIDRPAKLLWDPDDS